MIVRRYNMLILCNDVLFLSFFFNFLKLISVYFFFGVHSLDGNSSALKLFVYFLTLSYSRVLSCACTGDTKKWMLLKWTNEIEWNIARGRERARAMLGVDWVGLGEESSIICGRKIVGRRLAVHFEIADFRGCCFFTFCPDSLAHSLSHIHCHSVDNGDLMKIVQWLPFGECELWSLCAYFN